MHDVMTGHFLLGFSFDIELFRPHSVDFLFIGSSSLLMMKVLYKNQVK